MSPARRRMSTSDSTISYDKVTWSSVPKTKEYMDSLVLPSQERFEQIAHVQEEKKLEGKRRARQEQHLRSLLGAFGRNSNERDKAAKVIQKTFRGYRARREMEGHSLNASTRWVTAIREAQFRQSIKPYGTVEKETVGGVLALEDSADYRIASARQKWKKVSMVARRAGHDDSDSELDLDEDDLEGRTTEERDAAKARYLKATAKRRQAALMMSLQYFLEMVDAKHRYGGNLRMYHEDWKKSNTKENFFYWLDFGEGKHLELDTCPRDRLEREQVRYLSREERQYYLVQVDKEGHLRWVKNGARIDTTEQFKDSIHGVVPIDDPTPAFIPCSSRIISLRDTEANDCGSDSNSSAKPRRGTDSARDSSFENTQGFKKVTHISASTIFNQLLRKSVRDNTWIFVADTSFRLYVGIKDSGAFQHSSFLQGSRISAAGLIAIKNGRLSSLSPLSGHYRPPASNFRAFVRNLKEEGVDMSRVSISKSYPILVGLETYVKTRRKGKEFVGKLMAKTS